MRNFNNRTIWTGDNLDILRGLNDGSVDLIYLDPPFNSNANYAAPIGSQAAGAAFKDTWGLDDVDLAWHGLIADEHPGLYSLLQTTREVHGASMMSYLIYMSVRVMEMHRVLADTGSIYLHCDPTASHYLKLMMDSVFGRSLFRNEVIWHYQSGTAPRNAFGRKHDVIYHYAKTAKAVFNRQSKPVLNDKRYRFTDENGRRYDIDGRGKRYYLDRGQTCDDVWTYVHEKEYQSLNSQSKERTGYPTQKPLALVSRIIQASTNPGDVVLDPFAGCATACIAAEREGREWIGIDISAMAAKLVEQRMHDELGLTSSLVLHRTDIPARTDLDHVPRYNARSNKDHLYGRQQGDCSGCLHHFPYRNMTIDHIIPRKKGGSDHVDNLQLLCGACNSSKGTGSQAELVARLKEMGVRG